MPSEQTGTNGHGNVQAILDKIDVDEATRMVEEARAKVDVALETAAGFIRERPLVCLAGAIGLGFLIGKIASR